MKSKIFQIILLLSLLSVESKCFAQSTETKINDFFVEKLLIPYAYPEYNYRIGQNIESYTIIKNDSLIYKFIPYNRDKSILVESNVKINLRKLKGREFYHNNYESIYNLSQNKSGKDLFYQLNQDNPYIWINYNNWEEVIINSVDKEIIKLFSSKKHLVTSKVYFEKNKIIKISINGKANQNKYTFINDTTVVEKLIRNYHLSYKNTYFFNKKGEILKIRTIKYVKYLDDFDAHGLIYSYDKINNNIQFVPEFGEIKYKYTFDQWGNITSKTEFYNGEIINKIIIKYNYIRH